MSNSANLNCYFESAASRRPLINTPLQRGDSARGSVINRFSGFPLGARFFENMETDKRLIDAVPVVPLR